MNLAINTLIILLVIFSMFLAVIFRGIEVPIIYKHGQPKNWKGYSFKPVARIATKCEFVNMNDILDYGFEKVRIPVAPREKRYFRLNLAEECNQTTSYPQEVTAVQLSGDPDVFVVDVKVAAIERFLEANISTERSNIPSGLDVYWLLYTIPHWQFMCRSCRSHISTEVNTSSTLTSYIVSLGLLRHYFTWFVDPTKEGTVKKENKQSYETVAVRRQGAETETIVAGTPIRFFASSLQYLLVGMAKEQFNGAEYEPMDSESVWPMIHYAVCLQKGGTAYLPMVDCYPYIRLTEDGTDGECYCWGYVKVKGLVIYGVVVAWAAILILYILLRTKRRRLNYVDIVPPQVSKEDCKLMLKMIVRIWLPLCTGSRIPGTLTIKATGGTQNELIKVTVDRQCQFKRRYFSSNEVSETGLKIYMKDPPLDSIHNLEVIYESDSLHMLYLYGVVCTMKKKHNWVFPYGHYLESQRKVKLSELRTWMRIRRLIDHEDNILQERVKDITGTVTFVEVMFYILYSFKTVPNAVYVQINTRVNDIVGVLMVQLFLLLEWLVFYFGYCCFLRSKYFSTHLFCHPTVASNEAFEFAVHVAWLYLIYKTCYTFIELWVGLQWGDTLSVVTAQTFGKAMLENDLKWIYLCAGCLGLHYAFVIFFCLIFKLRRKRSKLTPGPMLSLEETGRDYLHPVLI